MKRITGALTALALCAAVALTGCASLSSPDAKDAGGKTSAPSEVVLSSTTSTQDSGLFDVLIPAFEKANPDYRVKIIAVGTGEALKLARSGDADVVLAHSEADEEELVTDGVTLGRSDVMYNDFVVLGPKADPAKAQSAADMTAAMEAISVAGDKGLASFYSRGDDSGTHKKELKLWGAASITTPTPEANGWYESTGSGMGDTLQVASDKQGYTISDRATFLSMKDALDLEILREGDKDLLNQYGVSVVKGAKNQAGGQAFADWITSTEGQKVIGEFGVDTYGQQLFKPNAQ